MRQLSFTGFLNDKEQVAAQMDGDGACGKGGYKYYYQSYSTVRPLSAPPLPLQQLRSEASLSLPT